VKDLLEFDFALRGTQRTLIVSTNAIDLRDLANSNKVYVFSIQQVEGAAGGRAGGFGQRNIERVLCFEIQNGVCIKLLDMKDPMKLSALDFPVGIARMPVVLKDGTEEMVYGVIDPDAVKAYDEILIK
jgi:hypothetical protein